MHNLLNYFYDNSNIQLDLSFQSVNAKIIFYLLTYINKTLFNNRLLFKSETIFYDMRLYY